MSQDIPIEYITQILWKLQIDLQGGFYLFFLISNLGANTDKPEDLTWKSILLASFEKSDAATLGRYVAAI